MEASIKEILLSAFVGAFAGYFYWTVLVVFVSGLYLQYTKANDVDRLLVLLVHVTFVPTLALLLLGIYGFYGLLRGDISIWFFIGSLLPAAIILNEALTKNNE